MQIGQVFLPDPDDNPNASYWGFFLDKDTYSVLIHLSKNFRGKTLEEVGKEDLESWEVIKRRELEKHLIGADGRIKDILLDSDDDDFEFDSETESEVDALDEQIESIIEKKEVKIIDIREKSYDKRIDPAFDIPYNEKTRGAFPMFGETAREVTLSRQILLNELRLMIQRDPTMVDSVPYLKEDPDLKKLEEKIIEIGNTLERRRESENEIIRGLMTRLDTTKDLTKKKVKLSDEDIEKAREQKYITIKEKHDVQDPVKLESAEYTFLRKYGLLDKFKKESNYVKSRKLAKQKRKEEEEKKYALDVKPKDRPADYFKRVSSYDVIKANYAGKSKQEIKKIDKKAIKVASRRGDLGKLVEDEVIFDEDKKEEALVDPTIPPGKRPRGYFKHNSVEEIVKAQCKGDGVSELREKDPSLLIQIYQQGKMKKLRRMGLIADKEEEIGPSREEKEKMRLNQIKKDYRGKPLSQLPHADYMWLRNHKYINGLLRKGILLYSRAAKEKNKPSKENKEQSRLDSIIKKNKGRIVSDIPTADYQWLRNHEYLPGLMRKKVFHYAYSRKK